MFSCHVLCCQIFDIDLTFGHDFTQSVILIHNWKHNMSDCPARKPLPRHSKLLYWFSCYNLNRWHWREKVTTKHALGVLMGAAPLHIHPMLLLMESFTAGTISLSSSWRKEITAMFSRLLRKMPHNLVNQLLTSPKTQPQNQNRNNPRTRVTRQTRNLKLHYCIFLQGLFQSYFFGIFLGAN